MQLYLSNLVDLALGKGQNLECENFNILHTLLHVILKKSNLANARIELVDELERCAEKLAETLPKEPAMCFKEFMIKDDGTKIKKRIPNVVCPRRSLLHIKKRWPRCEKISTSNANKENSSMLSNKVDSRDEKYEYICSELLQRISAIEGDMCDVTTQFKASKTALCEFQKLKVDFENLKNLVEENPAFMPDPRNCHVKLNIQSKNKASSETDTTLLSDDEESEDISEEVKWLKERMLELSESLKLHSECLKRLKCEEFPRIKKNIHEDLLQSMHSLKSNNCQEIKEIKAEFDCLKSRISYVSCQLKEMEKKMDQNQDMTSEELCTLRLDFMDKMKKAFSSNTSSDRMSQVIKTENLQGTEEHWTRTPPSSPCSKKSYNPGIETKSIQDSLKNLLLDSESDCTINIRKNGLEPAANVNVPVATKSDKNCACMCPAITSSICIMKKQVHSQNCCVKRLIKQLNQKLDRCEFESFAKDVNETISCLAGNNEHSTSAGCAIPLMRNVNCISCQATTNMTITTDPFPKLSPLKYGYVRKDSDSQTTNWSCVNCNNCESIKSECRNISSTNWKFYNSRNGSRRVGGSHTKLTKCMEVNRMRFRRMMTPIKCISSIRAYKNRFRKSPCMKSFQTL